LLPNCEAMMDTNAYVSTLAETAPTADALTTYDEAHFAVYLSLLHASADGVSDTEMCRDILGIDAVAEPERARSMLQSHLDRARWLSSSGRSRILES
jgi:hypothetical protein